MRKINIGGDVYYTRHKDNTLVEDLCKNCDNTKGCWILEEHNTCILDGAIAPTIACKEFKVINKGGKKPLFGDLM